MSLSRRSTITLFVFVSAVVAADSPKDVLARMDKAAAQFKSVSAKIKKSAHTAVLNDDDTETGSMWMSRSGKDVRTRIEFTQPDPRSLSFRGKKAEIYYPKINTVQEYDLGQHAALVDQFLLLGFGTKGSDLAKDYNVKVIDKAKVGDAETDHIELVPKSKKTKEQLTKVELWVATPDGYPVQQKFYWPSEDTTTITYTDIKINPSITETDLTLKLPPNAKREYPQK